MNVVLLTSLREARQEGVRPCTVSAWESYKCIQIIMGAHKKLRLVVRIGMVPLKELPVRELQR